MSAKKVLQLKQAIMRAPKVVGAPKGYSIAPGQVTITPSTSSQLPPPNEVFENTNVVEIDFLNSLQVPADSKRNYLLVQNNTPGTMYLSFTGAVSPFVSGVQIPTGQSYEPPIAPVNAFNISCTGSGICVTGRS